MAVLLLGKGFIGTALVAYLGKNNTVLMKRSEFDYTTQLDKHLKYNKYEFVINTSGYTGVPNIDACERDKRNCWIYNVEAPVRIAEACRKRKTNYIHLSSGCIYSGYDKEYEEDDSPNFGLFNDESSFYSKTKHAAERYLTSLSRFKPWIFRIRMPFTGAYLSRNLFNKIINYNKLIIENNSMTCVEDFCRFIKSFITDWNMGLNSGYNKRILPPGTYNVVNMGYANLPFIVSEMQKRGIEKDWDFCKAEELDTLAKRSNCVLSEMSLASNGYGLPTVKRSISNCLDTWVEEYKKERE